MDKLNQISRILCEKRSQGGGRDSSTRGVRGGGRVKSEGYVHEFFKLDGMQFEGRTGNWGKETSTG